MPLIYLNQSRYKYSPLAEELSAFCDLMKSMKNNFLRLFFYSFLECKIYLYINKCPKEDTVYLF